MQFLLLSFTFLEKNLSRHYTRARKHKKKKILLILLSTLYRAHKLASSAGVQNTIKITVIYLAGGTHLGALGATRINQA